MLNLGSFFERITARSIEIFRKVVPEKLEISSRGPEVLKIGEHPDTAKLDVVFVHGLEGDPYSTWQVGQSEGWLNWLGEDIEAIRLWTIRWNAAASSPFQKTALSIPETAHILLNLFPNVGIGKRPLAFVAHSLGGLLLKQLLRDAETLNRPEHQKVARATRCVFFIGTPHGGSIWATPASRLLGPLATDRLKLLLQKSPDAGDLDRWYAANAPRMQIETNTLYETQKTHGVFVVSTKSAVLGSEDTLAVPVEADHVQICKIPSRFDHAYIFIATRLRAALNTQRGIFGRISDVVADFRASYLFGESVRENGRKEERDALERWLRNSDSSRCLVVGPAGIGKSHLIVNWTQAITGWQVVFFPISARFGTDEPSVFCRGIAHALAGCANETLSEPQFDPLVFFKEEIHRLLVRWQGIPIVLVLDGIDEARAPGFDPTMIPSKLPPTVKLLFSARLRAGDHGPEGWSARLNLDGQKDVTQLEIGPLLKKDLEAALIDLGVSPGALTSDLIEEIYRVTVGEPLLLRLYADEIIEHSSDLTGTLSTFRRIQPGLKAYFRRWFDPSESPGLGTANRRELDAALAVLACAHGPLDSDSFLALVNNIHRVGALAAMSVLAPIQRLVIGDGSISRGFVLSHPKFRDFLREDHLSADTVKVTLEGFVDWAKATVDVESGTGDPPDYVAANLVTHLEEAGGSSEHYVGLLHRRWFDILDKTGRGFDGFSDTVAAYLRAAPATRKAENKSSAIVERLRAALCLGSLKSLGTNLPPNLLVMAAEEGLISPKQLLDAVKLLHPENQIGLLEIAIHILDDPISVDSAISKALAASDPTNKVDHLGRLFDRAPGEYRARISELLTDAIRRVANPQHRARVLLDQAARRGWQDRAMVDEAVGLIEKLEPLSQLPLIARLIKDFQTLYPDQSERWLQKMETVFASLPQIERAHALQQLAADLPGYDWRREARAILEPVFASFEAARVTAVKGASYLDIASLERAATRKAVVQFVSAEPGYEVATFNLIAQELAAVLDDYWRSHVLSSLLPLTPEAARMDCFAICGKIAEKLPTANNRTHAFLALAQHSARETRRAFVEAAWRDARSIDDSQTKRMAVARMLGSIENRATVEKIAGELLAEPGPHFAMSRAELFLALAPHSSLASDFYAAAIKLGMRIQPLDSRHNFFVRTIKQFPSERRPEIFRWLLEGLKARQEHVSLLEIGFLAENTPELWTKEDLSHAMVRGASLAGWEKAWLLSNLAHVAQRLSAPEVFTMAWELAASFSPEDRASLLRNIAQVSTSDRSQYAKAALAAADQISDKARHCREVIRVMPLLDEDTFRRLRPVVSNTIELLGESQRFDLRFALANILNDSERCQELRKCTRDAEKLRGDARFNAFISLACHLPDLDERLDAFDEALATLVGRSSIFHNIPEETQILLEVGGSDLIESVVDEFRRISMWWN